MSGRAVLWRKRHNAPLNRGRSWRPICRKALQIALLIGAIEFAEKNVGECHAVVFSGVAASVNPNAKPSDVLPGIGENIIVGSPSPHVDKLFPLYDVVEDINANPDSLTVCCTFWPQSEGCSD